MARVNFLLLRNDQHQILSTKMCPHDPSGWHGPTRCHSQYSAKTCPVNELTVETKKAEHFKRFHICSCCCVIDIFLDFSWVSVCHNWEAIYGYCEQVVGFVCQKLSGQISPHVLFAAAFEQIPLETHACVQMLPCFNKGGAYKTVE